jgi:hypothetical protein
MIPFSRGCSAVTSYSESATRSTNRFVSLVFQSDFPPQPLPHSHLRALAAVSVSHTSFSSSSCQISNASPVTKIVLYVASRVVASFIPRAGSPYGLVTTGGGSGRPVPPDSRYFSIFAAISWGAVMWLFQHRGETIQPGMFSSMTYLYRDSEVWQNLRTLLWHNQ